MMAAASGEGGSVDQWQEETIGHLRKKVAALLCD